MRAHLRKTNVFALSALGPAGGRMHDFPPRKRRARHDIILQILKIAKNGAKKTRIMLRARLSFDQLEQYLNHLSTAGFLTAESGIWKTTEKGLDVIDACELCCRLTEEIQ